MGRPATWLLGLSVWACSKPLPGPVALSSLDIPESRTANVGPVTSRQDAIAVLVRGDPLARRPRWPSQAQLDVLDDDTLANTSRDLANLEAKGGDLASLQLVSRKAPGTERTAIVRGHRLGLADTLIASYGDNPGSSALIDVGPLLSALTPSEGAALHTRHALAFLADTQPFQTALRQHGDRWVLEAWLDGPDIPLVPVAASLATPQNDALARSALGRLVIARAEAAPGDPTAGLAHLQRATLLALEQVAADRDGEQRDWRTHQQAVGKELGVNEPIGALLDLAASELTAAAGTDIGAGGALLALQARRLVGGCDWRPCQGLDRVETIARVPAWDAALAPWAQTWRVIALKRAIDGMEVGRDTVVFKIAIIDLVDALLGTGAHPIPATTTSYTRGEAALWAVLGASLGDPSPTTWDSLSRVLGNHLEQQARQVGSLGTSDGDAILDRIVRRSHP